MKIYALLPIALFLMMLALSCSRESGLTENIVTNRIQYDVTIVSPDPDYDWWVQNIEGSERERVVRSILQAAGLGKVKVYDFVSLKPLTRDDVKGILSREDTVSIESTIPPYNLVDTIIKREVRLTDITRIRFLEEWKMDENALIFEKKVNGICPLVEVYTETGELKGYKPLFWIFLDDRYPAEFESLSL